MLNYKIIKKSKPRGEFIFFNQKKTTTGVIDFSELKKISTLDDVNKNVIPDEIIEINFPISDHYYVVQFKSKNGWSLKKLICQIYKTGLSAGDYLLKYQPNTIKDIAQTADEFINKFALLSDKKRSDIIVSGNVVYVNIHDSIITQPHDAN
jgi:hypothetical protein